MRQLLIAATFVLNRGQQFAHESLQQRSVVGKMIVARGWVRHDEITAPPDQICDGISRGSQVFSDFAYRSRRFALSATPPRISDNLVAVNGRIKHGLTLLGVFSQETHTSS
jgi:hypothetical protein